MAHVTIVSSEPIGGPGGGITTFVGHWGRLLLERGDRVTWIIADPSATVHARPPRDLLPGAEVVALRVPPPVLGSVGPDLAFQRSSAAVAGAIPGGSDVVYLQDWGAQGLVPVRRRRLLGVPGCPLVTVLHGGLAWLQHGMQSYPTRFVADTCQEYAERYAAERSDFVVAPGEAMRRWLGGRGWRLPDDRTEVLGYPAGTGHGVALAAPAERGVGFRRLVFFGRLQTVKGLEVFVGAVRRLALVGGLGGVQEVVLLGGEAPNRIGGAREVVRVLGSVGVRARALTGLDSVSAQAFLAEHRADSLVVVPSLVENFPYAVIEATLVPGLNVICSRVGGVPEILGERGRGQLFDPHEEPLAEKIGEFLARGPLPERELARYDAAAANERWLGFHERVLAAGASSWRRPARPAAAGLVDVCVVHRDRAAVLEQALRSLEAQTDRSFSVTVVDDGSVGEQARVVFARLEGRYRSRGWRFVRQERAGLGAARNAAAGLGSGEYLLFLDADDVASPRLIEVLRAAAARSGADCLGCYALVFDGDEYPLEERTGAVRVPPLARVEPPGGALSTALVVNPFGLAVSLLRRDAFEAVGGYSIDRWLGDEDYELYVRLVSNRYDVDIVPELLVCHRRRPEPLDGDRFRRHERILRVFREQLAEVGLAELPDAVCGLQPPLALDTQERPHGGQVARRARRRLGRLSSSAGWEYADHLAEATTWRVLAGALAIKARNHLPRRRDGT